MAFYRSKTTQDGTWRTETGHAFARPQRFEALDGWRGLCALFVAIMHFPAASPLTQHAFFGNAWLFATAVLAVIAVGKLAIEPEERHLSRKFGSAWHHYAKRVRRWI